MPRAVLSSSTGGWGSRLFLRAVRCVLISFASLFAALLIAWAAGALYFDLPAPSLVRTFASLMWAVGAVALAAFGRLRGRILALLGFVGITSWWLTLRPTQDADWQPEVATLAYASRDGDRFTVHNIRNFEWRSATDFTPRHDTRDFDLANLRAADLFINYWGSPGIVHPIASFDFGPQDTSVSRSKSGRNEDSNFPLWLAFIASSHLSISPRMSVTLSVSERITSMKIFTFIV